MKVALFGGAFDPIHCGHLSVARAARAVFDFDRIYFVPAGRPPHRTRQRLADFEHRYAMVALACAGERGFLSSAAEAPSLPGMHYSIRTVRRFRKQLSPADRLFFLIGADAFLEFRSWFQWRALLRSVNFIIASRPGIDVEALERVFPAGEVLGKRPFPAALRVEEYRLKRGTVWMMHDVMEPVSATEIRRRAAQHLDIGGMVPISVAEYIHEQHLYE